MCQEKKEECKLVVLIDKLMSSPKPDYVTLFYNITEWLIWMVDPSVTNLLETAFI